MGEIAAVGVKVTHGSDSSSFSLIYRCQHRSVVRQWWMEDVVAMLMKSLWSAKASTTEEPREGKLYAGICTGVSGNWRF